MVSDKEIHRAFRTHTTLQTKSKKYQFFIFTIYQNYTLALNRLSHDMIKVLKCNIKWSMYIINQT